MALALKAGVMGWEIVMVNGHAAKMMREEIANGKKTSRLTDVNERGIGKKPGIKGWRTRTSGH